MTDGTDETHEAELRQYALKAVDEFIRNGGYSIESATVWHSSKVPACMKSWSLSSQDDMEWIAIFPPDYRCPFWAESCTAFGCNEVDIIDLPSGWELRVGFH